MIWASSRLASPAPHRSRCSGGFVHGPLGFGPGDIAGAHRENESIGVDDLVNGARAVALTVLRLPGLEPVTWCNGLNSTWSP